MTKIYMDVCCWNRPFDDQTQARVHLEAEAVLAVVSEIEGGQLQLLHSEVVDLEIANAPDLKRRERLQTLIPCRHRYVRHEQRMSARHGNFLRVRVANPLAWMQDRL